MSAFTPTRLPAETTMYTMPSCPNCKSRVPLWLESNVFACPSCGVQIRTNGKGVHLAANAFAGFGALIFLVVPGIECSQALQVSLLLAVYIAAYALVVGLFFEVKLEPSSDANHQQKSSEPRA